MSDDLVKQSIAELQDVVRCRCHPAYKDRGLRDPSCECDSAEAVKVVADRIEELEAKLATCEKYRDAYAEMGRIGTEAVRDLEAKLAKAVEALEKVSSMACMGSGIALGRMLKSDANAGDPWADELSARVEFARSAFAELKGET